MHEKGCFGNTSKTASGLFVFTFFSINVENFLAFDTRSILSKWVANGYLPSPSPHMPIAALAANRVIIIVINITFYLS